MEGFVKRLETILDYYNLNASSFADKIGVQRSSLSHLLSGRNKPSLDFIIKIANEFPDVDLYWILKGKGTFPKSNEIINPPVLKPEISNKENIPVKEITQNINQVTDLFNSIIEEKQESKKELTTSAPVQKNDFLIQNNSDINKIVIFYKDGTFEDFKPRS